MLIKICSIWGLFISVKTQAHNKFRSYLLWLIGDNCYLTSCVFLAFLRWQYWELHFNAISLSSKLNCIISELRKTWVQCGTPAHLFPGGFWSHCALFMVWDHKNAFSLNCSDLMKTFQNILKPKFWNLRVHIRPVKSASESVQVDKEPTDAK